MRALQLERDPAYDDDPMAHLLVGINAGSSSGLSDHFPDERTQT